MPEIVIKLPDRLDYTKPGEDYNLSVEEIVREMHDCILSELVSAVGTVVRALIYTDSSVKTRFMSLVREKLIALEEA